MRITRREMTFCLAGGGVLLALLYYLIVISPAAARRETLLGYIHKKEAALSAMIRLRDERERLRADKTRAEKLLAARGTKFTLLSFLEGVSRKVGVDDRILYMKPLTFPEQPGPLRPAGIEMKLDRISTRQLVNLLYRIECSGKLLNIRRIKIHRTAGGDRPLLKVTLQVNTYLHG